MIAGLVVFILVTSGYLLKNELVVATVNGQPISRFTLIRELEKNSGKQALESLIGKTLILQEAKRQNVSVGQQEIDQEMKKLEENFKSQGQDLEQLLAFQGMTKASLEEQIRLQKTAEKLADSTESAKVQAWFQELRGKAKVNYFKEL
ncbi:MAG: SurA N-terminal domain-containing protein [Microgenomates group bacterium]